LLERTIDFRYTYWWSNIAGKVQILQTAFVERELSSLI
jgi:hypothetical protein